jgi:16S rRNA processing protein RimM
MAASGKRIVVAQFAGSHGVRGEFKLRSYTEVPEAIFAYGPLTGKGGEVLTPSLVREVKPSLFICRAPEVTSREACEPFSGQLLSVPRDRLPPPDEPEEEFYISDLLGLEVRTTEGEVIGKVKALPNFGAGDLIEIAGPEGLMILPFSKDAVPRIDLRDGIVEVRLPEDEPEAESPAGQR